jgi:hypothetical protein
MKDGEGREDLKGRRRDCRAGLEGPRQHHEKQIQQLAGSVLTQAPDRKPAASPARKSSGRTKKA